MALNLQALRVFTAVAQAGGFSKAAVRLRLSQPAVSKAVLVLERQLGLSLIDRSGRVLQLTEAGAALFARSREMFAVERSAEEALRSLRSLEKGVLRLGASTTIATYLLPPLLGAFRARYPGVRLRITSANTRDIARALLQRRLDVALVEGPVSHSRIESRRWRDDELIIIAPPGHSLLDQAAPLAIASLATCDFIWRERGSGTREVAEAAFGARGLTPRISLILASTEAVKQSVAAGLGLAVMSREAASDQLAMKKVVEVRVADFSITRQLGRLRLSGREISPAAVAFEQMLEIGKD